MLNVPNVKNRIPTNYFVRLIFPMEVIVVVPKGPAILDQVSPEQASSVVTEILL